MKPSLLKIITLVFVAILTIGCSNKKAYIYIDRSSSIIRPIAVRLNNADSCLFSLKINDKIIDKGVIHDMNLYEFNILNQYIKPNEDLCKEIALLAAQNNNILQVSFSFTNLLDTIFEYQLTPTTLAQEEKIDFSGIGAKIVSKSASRNFNNELKLWLYRNRKVVDDSIFASFRTNYKYLTEEKNNNYVVEGEIPVIHNLLGNKYTVNSNLIADYYAIVACKDQKFIDTFVENSVVNDYQNLSTTKNNLSCIPEDDESGYYCIMLLGINKDYSYQQIPMAVVAVDNSAPFQYHSDYKHYESIESLKFKNYTRIILPNNAPAIFGCAAVWGNHVDGNSRECNVTFLVRFSGDAKSATIHRRGELCDPYSWGENRLPVADKTFYAKDGAEQRYTWKLHFNDGDNEIPISVEDSLGNKKNYNVIYRAEFVRSNAPQINIDNNIDIYN